MYKKSVCLVQLPIKKIYVKDH